MYDTNINLLKSRIDMALAHKKARWHLFRFGLPGGACRVLMQWCEKLNIVMVALRSCLGARMRVPSLPAGLLGHTNASVTHAHSLAGITMAPNKKDLKEAEELNACLSLPSTRPCVNPPQ